MLLNQRIIWDNNGTLTDLSANLNKYVSDSETIPFVSSDDKIYIGSDLPFNHRYFEVSTANDQASVVSVKLWDGSTWTSAVDVIDQTSDSSGNSLANSGIISWVKDRNESWVKEETTEGITNLTSLKVYNKYWIQISFSADLKSTTALKYIGHKFSDDNDLGSVYPNLVESNVYTAFESGKTNWNEQHIHAAEDIIKWLRSKGKIIFADQIFGWEDFKDASIHRCAFWIMYGFGDDFTDEKKEATEEYFRALNQQNFPIDKDGDGVLEDVEKFTEMKWTRV